MSAIASMNHLAIDIPAETFDDAVARLRSKGVECYIIEHTDGPGTETWVRSVYFTDPNGIKLELAALTRPFEDSDILADPMNEAGETVVRRRRVLEPEGAR